MKRENRVKTFVLACLQLLIFINAARSQTFNTTYTNSRPFVINTCKDYRKSIKYKLNKRLIALKKYVNPFFADWKYASDSNFTHEKLYNNPEGYVRLATAVALQKVQLQLARHGISLKFFDAYRPYSVTKRMWEIVPDDRYAANPVNGSGHNRGTSVDVTLVDLSTQQELVMPTAFDDFSEKAHHSYQQLPAPVIKNRALLKQVMEENGFVSLPTEWWHYSLPNASATYELLDLDFTTLRRLIK